MVQLRCSTIIAAPVDRVWTVLRDFNGHDRWHPAVERSEIELDEPSDKVSCVRKFRLRDGAVLREQLLSLSDRDHSFRYFIVEAPVPLHDYVADMRLRPVTSDGTTHCEWRARFDPPPSERAALARFVREEIMMAGFAALRRAVLDDAAPAGQLRAAPARSSSTEREAQSVTVTRWGGLEVMELRAIEVPDPGPGEARIRQTAIGVNFIDVYCRRGSFTMVPPGGVLGMEAAGVVERVGSGVTAVRPGDRVAYACAPPGAYTTLRNMRAEMLVKLPEELGDVRAAALLLKGMTASFLLHDVHAVKPGDRLLVHAAAGGVGQILCRWARAIGAHVTGVTSTKAKADVARRAGCNEVLLVGRADLADEVRGMSGGRGVDVVYDAIGADTFETSIACLAPRGHLVSFGQASGDVGVRSIDALASRSLTLSRPNYGHYTDTAEKVGQQAQRLFEALASGAVVADQPRVYPLADVRRAHGDLESRATTGSLVLVP
jgi:NADPH2:quinone reductase